MKSTLYRMDTSAWSVERAVFAGAGIIVIVLSVLTMFVHLNFSWMTMFVGGMLIFFALTGYCPLAMLLAQVLRKK